MGRIHLTTSRTRSVRSALTVHVGQVLLALRQRDQVSMRAVARGTGLSCPFICQIENGQSSPTADTLWALAKFFNVPVGQFFKGYKDV